MRKNKFRRERRANKEKPYYGDVALCPTFVGPGQRMHRFLLNIPDHGQLGIDYESIYANMIHDPYGRRKKIMNIAVVQEDGTENEFELEMCCATCATRIYGWTAHQFNKIYEMNESIKIPDNITTAEEFKQFVKTL